MNTILILELAERIISNDIVESMISSVGSGFVEWFPSFRVDDSNLAFRDNDLTDIARDCIASTSYSTTVN